MLEIEVGENGVIALSGRFDATQCDKVREALEAIESPRILDFAGLDYISSAGLGVLLQTQKRVMQSGGGLTLVNVNSHINDIFRFSGFDQIFQIQASEAP